MIVNEVVVAGAEGFEIPNVEVDDEFTLEVRVRVFSLERDQIDVSGYGSTESIPGSLRLKGVAVTWPTPAEPAPETLPPDYWESAQ